MVLLLALTVAAQEPDLKARRKLERAARDLATKGHKHATGVLLAALRDLGHDEKAVELLGKLCARRLALAKKVDKKIERERKLLREAVVALASDLPGLPEERRAAAARAILSIDASQEAAQKALGLVRSQGAWVTPERAKQHERQAAIAAALQRTERLVIEVEHDKKGHPLLKQIEGLPGHAVRSHDIVLVSNRFPPHVLERCVKRLVQAVALSSYLRGGKLEPTRLRKPITFVIFASHDTYKRWVDGAIKRDIDHVKSLYSYRLRGARIVVTRYRLEQQLLASALLSHWLWLAPQTYGSRVQACLATGHVGWVSYYFFGSGLPRHHQSWIKERKETRTGTSVKQQERLLELAKTGLYGSRALMRHLAREKQDPPWRHAMVDRLSSIDGLDSLKCMFVVEYLQETGALGDLLRRTADTKARPHEVIGKALGEPIAAFEQGWRTWLLPEKPEPDLLTRLRGGGPKGDPVADRLLAHLNDIRQRACTEATIDPLWLDPELSAGARAHGRYLAIHKEQLSKWPDAHEEYPDREGFSVAGQRAGGHGVIVGPGMKDPVRAVDIWMGTFYHRLPLLHPWLLGIGWGMDEGIAVLDCTTLVMPVGGDLKALWPPDGSRDVPLVFNPELPNPVPGEDQSRWGYPITLQLYGELGQPKVTMELLKDDTQPVACHYSTPFAPTNADLAPTGAYCLMPKAHLKPKTDYTVIARHAANRKVLVRWSFRTR